MGCLNSKAIEPGALVDSFTKSKAKTTKVKLITG